MTNQTRVLARAVLYSFFSGVAAVIIYLIIALLTGAKFNGNTLLVGLVVFGISFVIALVFYSSFMLYFARKKA
jgi:hypothetical protein